MILLCLAWIRVKPELGMSIVLAQQKQMYGVTDAYEKQTEDSTRTGLAPLTFIGN